MALEKNSSTVPRRLPQNFSGAGLTPWEDYRALCSAYSAAVNLAVDCQIVEPWMQ